MCDDRKLERVGVVRQVAGIHFGWDSADHVGAPQCTTGTYQLVLRNDATAAISISSMEGLLRRVRHIELRAKSAKYIQMLVKKKRLLLEHIPGRQNPSDGLTRSFKTRDKLINLEREVGLVPGLDTNSLCHGSELFCIGCSC